MQEIYTLPSFPSLLSPSPPLPPCPFLPLFFPPLSFSSLSSPPLTIPSLPLEVPPFKSSLGVGGAVISPSEVWGGDPAEIEFGALQP